MKPWAVALLALRALADPAAVGTMPADSLAAFRSDSASLSAIHSVEAGNSGGPRRSAAGKASFDSLERKLEHRHIAIGFTAGISFTEHSAQDLFANHLDTIANRDSLQILQPYDPVDLFFPVGLMVTVPLSRHLDLWVRTDHFWYTQSALAQGTGPAQEFWFAVQAQLAGLGIRYLIPVTFLSVSGRPGLYVAYTQYWNFANTEMYAPTGSVRARTELAGAGYEIQAGFQQDFSRRWTVTGGLSFANFDFQSRQSWRAILPDAPDTPAEWQLRALRLTFQFLYQFKVERTSSPPASPPTDTPPPGGLAPKPLVPKQ